MVAMQEAGGGVGAGRACGRGRARAAKEARPVHEDPLRARRPRRRGRRRVWRGRRAPGRRCVWGRVWRASFGEAPGKPGAPSRSPAGAPATSSAWRHGQVSLPRGASHIWAGGSDGGRVATECLSESEPCTRRPPVVPASESHPQL